MCVHVCACTCTGHTYVQACIDLCAHECEDQNSILGVVSMSHPLIYFGAKVSHWPIVHQVDVAGCPVSYNPKVWNYKCAPSSLGPKPKFIGSCLQASTLHMRCLLSPVSGTSALKQNKVTQGFSQCAQVTCCLNGHSSVCEYKTELYRKKKDRGLGTAQPVRCLQ